MKAKGSSSLTSTANSKHTITTLAGTNASPLTKNTWGYALPDQNGKGFGSEADYTNPTASTTFAKIPSSTDNAVAIKSTDTRPDQTTGDSTKVAYGVNQDTNQPSGTYQTDLVYTVTANPFQ